MTEERGYAAAMELLDRATPPTAIFAANDLSCVGALGAAAQLGLRVPEDLSLVGFDNSGLARLRATWLTSVDGSAGELGRLAAERLLERIEQPAAPAVRHLMPQRLQVRGSTAPPPAGPAA